MNRRDFLKVSLASATAFTLSGLTVMTPNRAEANELYINLVAEAGFKTMIDGTDIYVWQFTDLNGTGPGVLPSGLLLSENDTVNVTLENTLDREINFYIPGVLEDTPAIGPGETYTYTFTAPTPGSYKYYDQANGRLGRAMGLAGPMVVMPEDDPGTLYPGGPSFDRQYTLVLNELDDRLNEAVYNGQSYDMADYEPNYFFVNGLSYPNTADDEDTRVKMELYEDVAIRFINTGLIMSPQHFHGYHVNVVSRNRQPETTVVEKDTVVVNVDECVDIILPVAQPGVYPLHTHFVPGVTANGTYLNPYGGALIVMSTE